MFDKFCDYMYYLLTTPFKLVKKSFNQWYIFCQVFGRYFDDAMESLYHAADQTMIATCEPEMLMFQAEERGMTRYQGESDENFRKRIANYAEVCRLGGSDEGVLLAVRSLGFDSVSIVKAREMDAKRWAEFYVIVNINPDDELPIGYDVLMRQVRKVKYTTALDNYYFNVHLSSMGVSNAIARSIFVAESVTDCLQDNKLVIRCKSLIEQQAVLYVHVKNNLWYFDGTYSFDGSKTFDAYETREEL